MKKILLVLTACLFVVGFCTSVFAADDTYRSSTRKTADALISNHSATVKTLLITADGTNSCSVVLYNHASAASGDINLEFTAGAGTVDTVGFNVPPTWFSLGIYADMTTSGTCKYEVLYR